ncbi:MAG: transketolase [Kiritimatiellae bacterium]|nr:transketolase [Kiritimatiellia bacterium]
MSDVSLYRREIVSRLIPYAEKDRRIYLLIGDMGFGVADKFRERFPDRVFNTGVMEQGTIGIAAGMAMSGLIPVVYSIVNFLAYRAIEQVRNDIILQDLNVKLIGTGANNYFAFLGRSHCCDQDDKKIMNIVGMPVFDPYEGPEDHFEAMIREWLSSGKAGYIRV